MGEFNSDDHYIYYCGQESFRRNGVAIIVNKRFWNAVLGCNLKNDRMIPVHFQAKPFSNIVIQVYPLSSNAEEAEVEQIYEDLLELTPQKDVIFIIGDWNAKVGSQETPGVTSIFGLGIQNSRPKANIVFVREHTGHSKHPLPTAQEKTLFMDIISWSIPKSDWLYSLQLKYNSQRLYSLFYTVSKKQDWELTVAEIMNSLLPNSDLNWKK